MNPHAVQSISPVALLSSLYANRSLIYSLTKREVVGRYRGSVMGLAWSFLNPVLMLAVYTFFFSVVFKARWPGGGGSKTEFALVLFAGLLVFNVFAECVGRAPVLVLSNVNYVKKIIFPLEILPFVSLGTAGFHFLINFGVWFFFSIFIMGPPSIQIMCFPLILLPFVMLVLGMSWILASLGVYLRDVGQVVSVSIPVIMFLSPIFFPITALPLEYHFIFKINPLTFVIEQSRDVLLWNKGLSWLGWSKHMFGATLFAWLGYCWFQKTRKGFADVL